MTTLHHLLLLVCLFLCVLSSARAYNPHNSIRAFNTPNCIATRSSFPGSRRTMRTLLHSNSQNQILILDHININHQKGRHDLVKAFYFDFLQCAIDPRKEENLLQGRKTLWANVGSFQFHLPEGNPNAQVFKGIISLAFPSTEEIIGNYESDSELQNKLRGSKFSICGMGDDGSVQVTDPWGTQFRLIQDASKCYADTRGSQPGDESKGISMVDLTIFLSKDVTNFFGISRFYKKIFGASCLSCDDTSCVVQVGPKQTLTFRHATTADINDTYQHSIHHEDLEQTDEGIANYGAHVSMYIANFPEAYQRADIIGVTYVNPRFKRRAYNLDEAINDCMFRILDIVDPDNIQDGPIFKLEHEVRSVVKRDGTKYKSCPFYEIPKECKILENSSTDKEQLKKE